MVWAEQLVPCAVCTMYLKQEATGVTTEESFCVARSNRHQPLRICMRIQSVLGMLFMPAFPGQFFLHFLLFLCYNSYQVYRSMSYIVTFLHMYISYNDHSHPLTSSLGSLYLLTFLYFQSVFFIGITQLNLLLLPPINSESLRLLTFVSSHCSGLFYMHLLIFYAFYLLMGI